MYNFGKEHIDMDDEDFNAIDVFSSALPSNFFEYHNNPEKFCTYACQLNNLAVDCADEYPKYISKVNTFVDFIYVLMLVTQIFPEENIIDLKLLFNCWIDFLNDSADAIDKVDTSKKNPGVMFADYFYNKIEKILQNEQEDA
jgi:hypothetical protein